MPAGGIPAAASRAYDKVLYGAFAREAALEEGISYESYRLWLSRNQNRSPSRMLNEAKVGTRPFSKIPQMPKQRPDSDYEQVHVAV